MRKGVAGRRCGSRAFGVIPDVGRSQCGKKSPSDDWIDVSYGGGYIFVGVWERSLDVFAREGTKRTKGLHQVPHIDGSIARGRSLENLIFRQDGTPS